MQTILAIETSQAACSIALRTAEGVAQRAQLAERQHATVLLPMIEGLLNDCGVSPDQLDCVAFGCGPGSFTGARIAASVAQGLAFGCDATVIPVSSLRALAHTVVQEQDVPSGSSIFVAVDAHMEELYSACYCNDPTMSAVQSDALLNKFDCYERLKSLVMQSDSVHLFGDGLNVMTEYIGASQDDDDTLLKKLNALSATQRNVQPGASSVLHLAELALSNNERFAPEQAVPAYLRGSSAWKKMTDK